MLLVLAGNVLTNSEQKWKSADVAQALYGLQSKDNDLDEVSGLKLALIEKIQRCKTKIFNAQHISMCFYGLQNADSACKTTVGQAIAFLKDRLRDSATTMTALAALEDLVTRMNESKPSGDDRESMMNATVYDSLVGALTDKLKEVTGPLEPQHVGNMLYGLQRTDNRSPAVRKLLTALSVKVGTCTNNLSDQHVHNAMYGIQRMMNYPKDKDAVKEKPLQDLLGALASQFKHKFTGSCRRARSEECCSACRK